MFGAVMAGAAGYVLKQVRGGDLVGAVRTAAAGGSLLDARTTLRVLERVRTQAEAKDPLAALNPRRAGSSLRTQAALSRRAREKCPTRACGVVCMIGIRMPRPSCPAPQPADRAVRQEYRR